MPSFGIFQIENGGIRLIRSAGSMKDAKARMKTLAASRPDKYMVCANGREKKKRIFLIGYNARMLEARAGLLVRFGHDVFLAFGNSAAMRTLQWSHKIDLFVVGSEAPEQTRREMVSWLRLKFRKVKIVSLNRGGDKIGNAHYNIRRSRYEGAWVAAAALAS